MVNLAIIKLKENGKRFLFFCNDYGKTIIILSYIKYHACKDHNNFKWPKVHCLPPERQNTTLISSFFPSHHYI